MRWSVRWLLLVSLLGCALAGLARHNRQDNRYAPGPLSEREYAQLAAKAGWRAERVEVDGGVVLRGLVRQPDLKPGPANGPSSADWVLFLPGNASAQLSSGQAFFEALHLGPGIGLAVWADRGFDGSGGRPEARRFEADTLAIYRHLRARVAKPGSRVHLIGFSLGADLALALGAELGSSDERPTTVTLMSPYPHDYCMAEHAWYSRFRLSCDRIRLDGDADRLAGPVLLLHGDADTVNDVSDSRALAASLGPRGRYVELPGGDHPSPLSDRRSLDAIRTLISQSGVR